MSDTTNEWSELQQAWQSQRKMDMEELDAVRAQIARARRAAQWRTALDVASCLLGGGIGIWSLFIGTPSSITIGLAALAFTTFGGWLTWQGARSRQQTSTGTVIDALDTSIALERAAEDWARAFTTMAPAAMAFLGVVMLVTAADFDTSPAQLRRVLGVSAITLLAVAIATAVGQRFAARVQRRRHVLEQRRNEIAG